QQFAHDFAYWRKPANWRRQQQQRQPKEFGVRAGGDQRFCYSWQIPYQLLMVISVEPYRAI
ncbi:MAG: hypothetical protein Q8M35_07400, partial [Pseudohongiella sp.]|nr:hypothetical protein [Pseudohongiella sp.]